MIDIQAIEAARERIRGHVRHTPLLRASPMRAMPGGVQHLSLKLECLQIIGSFKARGATNKLLTLSDAEVQRGLVTASGGNHGLGVAYAGWLAKVPATIYLPRPTPPQKAEKLQRWGAKLLWEGEVWDDAHRAALAAAEAEGLTYFHPFADEAVICGQGTVALEILEDASDVDVLIVAMGGGGLMAGVSTVFAARRPATRIIGVEPVGAPKLFQSVQAGKLVRLEKIATEAGTLAPRQSAQVNFDIVRRLVDQIVLVSDEEMREAARWLWFELGIAAELSGAASVAALLAGKLVVADGQHVCAIVCGAGTDGMR